MCNPKFQALLVLILEICDLFTFTSQQRLKGLNQLQKGGGCRIVDALQAILEPWDDTRMVSSDPSELKGGWLFRIKQTYQLFADKTHEFYEFYELFVGESLSTPILLVMMKNNLLRECSVQFWIQVEQQILKSRVFKQGITR